MLRRGMRTLIAAVALVGGTAVSFGHDGIEHLLGTVTAVTGSSVTLETVKHAIVTVTVDSGAALTHNAAKAALGDLKVGERVAVDAKEGADKKLKAVAIRWGSASSLKMPADHKM